MQILKTTRQSVIILLAATALVACGATNKKGKTKSGIDYQIISKGKGKKSPKVGDFITMHIKVYVSDSMLFDSYKLNNNEPVPAQVAAPQFNGDIMEVLTMMKDGDSAVFKVPQDSLFRQDGMKPPFVKKGDMVLYNVKLISVSDKAAYEKEQQEKIAKVVAQEDKVIDDYIAKNSYTNVLKSPSGVRVIITKPGTGPNAASGNTVKMNYTGMLMDGQKFDSNILPEFKHIEPLEFPLGAGRVIKGWDEAIAMLNKGAKAIFVIPSPLAYGAQGNQNIAPNSILIFETELLDFKK
jgi:FKBP-type peptidyl-prolyl cis-trans isomerase FkpA